MKFPRTKAAVDMTTALYRDNPGKMAAVDLVSFLAATAVMTHGAAQHRPVGRTLGKALLVHLAVGNALTLREQMASVRKVVTQRATVIEFPATEDLFRGRSI